MLTTKDMTSGLFMDGSY